MNLREYTRDTNFTFIQGGTWDCDILQTGAQLRIADAMEALNRILRNESHWCEIRANLRRLANRNTMKVRHEYHLQIRFVLPKIRWPWKKVKHGKGKVRR